MITTNTLNNNQHDQYDEHAHHVHLHHEEDSKAIFGFWIYIMSDCILFSIIFATYAVLHNNIFGGLAAKELFSMPFVLTETFLLLTSSFTYGLAMLAVHNKDKTKALLLIVITFLLGLSFIAMELHEFADLIHEGNGPQRSAFLSAFFTLVGTHGLHVSIGLLWMIALTIQLVQRGITGATTRKLTILGLFWHFLDIVWIFVFTIVYLMGAV